MRRWLIAILLWVALLLVAVRVDRKIAVYMHDHGIAAEVAGSWLAAIVKFPGTILFALAIVFLGIVVREFRPEQVIYISVAFASCISGALIKWLVGRTRPYKLPGPDMPYPFVLQPLRHGFLGLFNQRDLSFPSGHACASFALATAIILIRPKLGWILLIFACFCGAERVFENAHYLSDVVGGAGIGAAGAALVHRLFRDRLKIESHRESTMLHA